MSRAVLAGLISLCLAGCASVATPTPGGGLAPAPPRPPPPPKVELGAILGQGTFRTLAGARASCAGQSVALMAETPRSRARIVALYGSITHAVEPISLVQSRAAKLGPANDNAVVDSTTCAADGSFHFANVAAGGYFLIARVRLSRPEHGQDQFVVMQATGLRPGETREVRLTP